MGVDQSYPRKPDWEVAGWSGVLRLLVVLLDVDVIIIVVVVDFIVTAAVAGGVLDRWSRIEQ